MSSSGNIREVKEYYYNNSNQVSEMILHVPNKDTEYYKYSYYYNGKPQKIIQETNYGHVLTSEYDYYGNMTKQIQTLSPTERYITEYKHGLIQKGINIDTASHRVQIDRYVNGELDYIEPIQITKEIENNSRKNISKIYESSLDYDKNQLLESISNELENVYTIDDIEYYQQLLEKVPECVSKNILRDRISLKQYHYYFCETNKDNLFAGINNFNSFWMQYDAKNQCHGAWKMHLYADGELDWQKMAETVVPYLKKNDIEWKTVSQITSMDTLRNDTLQAGKAFTIYPRNNEHMAQVIRDLDNLIRINGLRTRGTNIIGDRAIGDNGRLFYRYEYSTGKAKDLVLDLNTKSGYARYDSLYDSNSDRVARHGEGRYLADDMTSADDPWLNFRI